MKLIPVAAVDQMFCSVMEYVTTSPELLGCCPVKIFVIIRSAIGAICATAEVSVVVIFSLLEKSAVVVIVGNDRTVVVTLAVIVTEKLLFAGM